MESRKKAGDNHLSFIGLGCWRFGEPESSEPVKNPGKSYWGGQLRKNSLKTIDAALRGGISHFDTAQSYGLGRSEQITGQRLRKVRKNCIISTKIMIDKNSSIEKKIELSLKRLNTDYIDVLYIHWPSDSETIKKAVNEIEKAKLKGKIRYTGISNFSLKQMKTACTEGKIDFHQTGYSLLWRESEKEIIPFCVENNISVIGYSFFAQGLLAAGNSYKIGIEANDRRRELVFFKNGNEEKLNIVLKKLQDISDKTNFSLTELLISWGKSKKWLDSVLIGAKNRKQIEEVIKSETRSVKKEIIDEIDSLTADLKYIKSDYGNIFNHSTGLQD